MANDVSIPLNGRDAPRRVDSEEGPNSWLCPIAFKPWNTRTACLFVWGVLITAFAIASAGLLIWLSVTHAGPQLKIVNFVAGDCTVVNSTFIGNRSCVCSSKKKHEVCYGTYPCLKVTVKYDSEDGRVIESMLHEGEQNYIFKPDCSYYPDYCSKGSNSNDVGYFRSEYGWPKQRYPCFHNPTGPGAVISRTRGVSYVVHTIFWPALFTLIFSILWCVIFCYCCRRDK